MLRDLHLPYPPKPEAMVIVPTTRDSSTSLALSSRNAYLTAKELQHAPALAQALQAAASCFKACREQHAEGLVNASEVWQAAIDSVEAAVAEAEKDGVTLKLDYISLNDPVTLETLHMVPAGSGAVVSGALYCGKTRLIDNIVLDYDLNAAVN